VHYPRVIYALTEPDTGEVRYIGQARHLWQRYAHHLLPIQGTPAKVMWLHGLQRRGLFPSVRVLEEVTAADVDERERWWIEHSLAQGARLVNGPLQRHDTVRWNLHLSEHLRACLKARAQARGLQDSQLVEELLWLALAVIEDEPAKETL
jgi:hypothetical protein